MKSTRRKHSDAFKTEVVLEAIRERKIYYSPKMDLPTKLKRVMYEMVGQP